MAPRTFEATARRGTWRTDEFGRRRRSWRYFQRVVLTLLAVALLSLVCFLTLRPIWHPNTHVGFLATHDAGGIHVPPVEFTDQAFAQLRHLQPALYQKEGQVGPVRLNRLGSPATMELLASDLAALSTGRTDVLIVYVAADGISYNNQPYLLCENFNPRDFPSGLYPVRELVQQVGRSSARVKLLILDTGRWDYDPRLGVLVNDFPLLLQQLVQESGVVDDSFWIFNANGAGERSHLAKGLRQSVFGHFLTQGLQGAADLDGDRVIHLGELHRYVASQVAAWVAQSSAGSDAQTPILIGNKVSAEFKGPALISVAPLQKAEDEPAGQSPAAPPESVIRLFGFPDEQATWPLAITDSLARFTPAHLATWSGKPRPVALTLAQNTTPGNGSSASPAAPPVPASTPSNRDAKQSNGTAGSPAAAEQAAGRPTPAEREAPVPAGPLEQLGQLRREFESRRDGISPLDTDAHLWRIVVARMQRIERLDRAGRTAQSELEAGRLIRLLESTRTSLEVRGTGRPTNDLERNLAARIREATLVVSTPRSLAMAERWPAQDLHSPPDREALKAVAEKLDAFLHGGNRQEFTAWVGQLTSEQRQLVELQLAERLAQRDDIAWPLVQRVLRARRTAEQLAAAHPDHREWVQGRLEQADRLLVAAERSLFDSLADSGDRAAAALSSALRQYDRVATDLEAVRFASRTANDLVFLAPYYVRLHNSARRLPSGMAPRFEELDALLRALADLSDLLAYRDPDRLPALRVLTQRCQELRTTIEAELREQNVALLSDSPEEREAAWKLNVLLDSPLLDTRLRDRLKAVAARADSLFAERFLPPAASEMTAQMPQPVPMDWESLRQQCMLEVSLAHLAAQRLPTAERSLEAVERAYDDVRGSSLTAGAGGSPWERVRALGEALRTFYGKLPDHIEDAVRDNRALSDPHSRGDRLRVLRYAQHALRLLDARDAGRIHVSIQQPLGEAARYDLLAWQSRRFMLAQAFASQDDIGGLREIVEDYHRQALQVPGQPLLALPDRPVVRLEFPKRPAVSDEPESDLPIVVRNRGASPLRAWIALRYDPRVLDVTAAAGQLVYQETLPDVPSEARLTVHPDPRPTLSIPPGEAKTLQLRLRRIGRSPEPATLLVKAVTESGVGPPPQMFFLDHANRPVVDPTRAEPTDSRAFVQYSVAIGLPQPETTQLSVRGTPGTWTVTDDGLVLHPFPNQATPYQFLLGNKLEGKRTVHVRLLAPTGRRLVRLPGGVLSADEAAELLESFGPVAELQNLAEVELPADGRPIPIPFAEAGADNGGAESPPGTAPQEGSPGISALAWVESELLLVVTDVGSQTTMMRRIACAPQRPRRYVAAQVGYDTRAQRVRIQVRAVEPSFLPPDGVAVEAQFAEPLPVGTQAKLKGRLAAPDFTAELYADIPKMSGRVVDVSLNVDGYPRAFVYRVPVDVDSASIGEEAALRAVRILEPAANASFRAPLSTISVNLQVDAPVGSFQSPDDFVEVGIDANLDRDFRGEPTIKLRSDRQSRLSVLEFAPDGLMRVRAEVGDYRLEIPVAGLQNAQANVLARLQVGPSEAWSEPVKVLFDGAPPRVGEVELTPGRIVEIGQELELAIGVSDPAGSGVGKVQCALDVAGAGRFVDDPPPVDAKHEAGLRWVATLDTAALKPGTYTILVRATDVVGNVSDYVAVKNVEVITPEMAAQRSTANTNRVTGVVRFGTEAAANITMTLESLDEEGPQVPPVQSDATGNFVFPEVVPGKYRLSAAGKFRNAGRRLVIPRGQEHYEVTVAPPPAAPTRLHDVKVR